MCFSKALLYPLFYCDKGTYLTLTLRWKWDIININNLQYIKSDTSALIDIYIKFWVHSFLHSMRTRFTIKITILGKFIFSNAYCNCRLGI